MEEQLRHERYPLLVLDLGKDETDLGGVDAIVSHLRERIDNHRWCRFIASFDHLAHTRSLAEGQIDPQILAAKNLVFCFGLALPEPAALGLRPRSIGICELHDRFVLSYVQAPMPVANTLVGNWLSSLRRPLGA